MTKRVRFLFLPSPVALSFLLESLISQLSMHPPAPYTVVPTRFVLPQRAPLPKITPLPINSFFLFAYVFYGNEKETPTLSLQEFKTNCKWLTGLSLQGDLNSLALAYGYYTKVLFSWKIWKIFSIGGSLSYKFLPKVEQD